MAMMQLTFEDREALDLHQEIIEIKRKYIPQQILDRAEDLGVEIVLGEQGPIFIGENELIKVLEEEYESLMDIEPELDDEMSAEESIDEAVSQIRGTDYSGLGIRLHDKLTNKVSNSQFKKTEKMQKQENEKREIEEKQKDKEMDIVERRNALAKLNPNLKKVASALGVSINIGKNGSLLLKGKAELVERVKEYATQLTSKDIYVSAIADSKSGADDFIKKTKEDLGLIDRISRDLNHVDLTGKKQSLSDIQKQANEEYQKDYNERLIRGEINKNIKEEEEKEEELVRELNVFSSRY